MDSKKTIVTMIGRRWFDKTYGNTYHTVTVLIDGRTEYTSPVTYGYGDCFIQTGTDWLVENGYITKEEKPKYYGTAELREMFEFSYHVSDVARKRDL